MTQPPLDYAPNDYATAADLAPDDAWTQPSGVRRGLIAAGVAGLAATAVCFFPAATIAIAIMAGTVWLGDKWFFQHEEVSDA